MQVSVVLTVLRHLPETYASVLVQRKRNVIFIQKKADEMTFVFDLLLSLDSMLYLPWPHVTSRHIVVETYELCQTYKQSVFSI